MAYVVILVCPRPCIRRGNGPARRAIDRTDATGQSVTTVTRTRMPKSWTCMPCARPIRNTSASAAAWPERLPAVSAARANVTLVSDLPTSAAVQVPGGRLESRRAKPPYTRVMAKVERRGECLVFTGKRSKSGYGRTSLTVDGHTQELWAHRVVYEHHHGPIPPGLFVLHSCDNRPCVELTHLRTGTLQENAADMVARARGRAGTVKEECARGHDLSAPGAVTERRTRSKNPSKSPSQRCVECQREDVRKNRARQGYAYTGQPTNRDKTHCKRGHAFTPENTRPLPRGGRACKACARAYVQARKFATAAATGT